MSGDDEAVLHFRCREVHYERRIVAFYDVLGWQDKIEQAGTDPVALARLRNVISYYSLLQKKERRENNMRFSTFSDNVVVSADLSEIKTIIVLLAHVQIIAVVGGCLLRGGVTIGDIAHDQDVVFGPALNRAYDIERKIAVYPRIVIDPDCADEFKDAGALLTLDEMVRVDPFRRRQFEKLCKMTTTWRWERGEIPAHMVQTEFENEVMNTFTQIFHALTKELERPLRKKEWDKVAWLFNRVAVGFGIPERADQYRTFPDAPTEVV